MFIICCNIFKNKNLFFLDEELNYNAQILVLTFGKSINMSITAKDYQLSILLMLMFMLQMMTKLKMMSFYYHRLLHKLLSFSLIYEFENIAIIYFCRN